MTSSLKTLLEDADNRATTVGADGRTVRLLALQLLTWAHKSHHGKLPQDIVPLDLALLKKSVGDCFEAAKNAIRYIYPEAPPLPDCWNHVDFLSWLNRIERVTTENQLKSVTAGEIHELVTRPYELVSSITFIEPEIVQYMVQLLGDIEGKVVYCPFDLSGQFSAEVARVGGKAIRHSPTPYSAIESIKTLCNLEITDYTGNPFSPNQSSDTAGTILESDGNLPLTTSFERTIAVYPGKKLLVWDDAEKVNLDEAGPEAYFMDELARRTTDRLITLVSGAILKHHNTRKQAKLKQWNAKYGFKSVTELPSLRILGANTTHYVLDLSMCSKPATIIFSKASSLQYTQVDGRKKAVFNNWKKLIKQIDDLRDEARNKPEEILMGPIEIVKCSTIDGTEEKKEIPPGVMAMPRSQIVSNGEIKLNPSFYLIEKKDENDEGEHYLLSELANFIRPSPLLKRAADEFGVIDPDIEGEPALELSTSDFATYGYTPLDRVSWVEVKTSKGTPNTWLRDHDLVMLCKGAEGSIGKIAIVAPGSAESKLWCVSQMSIIIRLKPEMKSKIDPRALYMHLRMPTTKFRILGLVSTDLVRNLRAEEIGKLKVPKFTPEEQDFLVEKFMELDEKATEVRKIQSQANEIFGTVFKKFFVDKNKS